MPDSVCCKMAFRRFYSIKWSYSVIIGAVGEFVTGEWGGGEGVHIYSDFFSISSIFDMRTHAYVTEAKSKVQ